MRARVAICSIWEADPRPRTGLDLHAVSFPDERADTRRRNADPVLVILDLPGYADVHGRQRVVPHSASVHSCTSDGPR